MADTKKCEKCKKHLTVNRFIKGNDNGYDFWCSKCRKSFVKNLERLIIYCKENGRIFNQDLWNWSIKTAHEKYKDMSEEELEQKAINLYFSKMNLIGMDGAEKIDTSSDEYLIKKYKEEAKDDAFEITEEMVARWGDSFDIDDYRFLENEFNKLITAYTCETPIQEMIYEEISITRLQISKSRNDPKNYKTLMDNLRNLLTDANIKPNQELSDYGLNTWGEWIRKIEEEEPIPKPSKEFEDVDGIRKYIEQWFVGHFSRIFGLSNEGEG